MAPIDAICLFSKLMKDLPATLWLPTIPHSPSLYIKYLWYWLTMLVKTT